MIRRPPRSTRTDTLVPYTTLFRSCSLLIGSKTRRKSRMFFIPDCHPLDLTSNGAKTLPVVAACFRSNRSEEHTSELQSLMRISYAVFCLKNKNKNKQSITPPQKQNQTNKTE